MNHLSFRTMQTVLLFAIFSLICEGCSARTPKRQNLFMKEMVSSGSSRDFLCQSELNFV